jgi:S-DNA-T family DNA segregation ATPase FtsK/SpoIIIE
MLVGGQTGSGKSEFLRQILCSLALSSNPRELKMVIVDPKMTDYQDINGSPYLERPVVDGMDLAVEILAGLVDEMESRYDLFRRQKVKDLETYNALSAIDPLARIVLTFDEFADAMADKRLKAQIEVSVKRLGAKARAAGIHLVIATQSPRKEVVTGLIKANLPCAVALQVASGTESRIILDSMGAEKLLGRGDLMARFGGKIRRLQSPYADTRAVRAIMFP